MSECYICALGDEDKTQPVIAWVEGSRSRVPVCDAHYSAVVWASGPAPRITRTEAVGRHLSGGVHEYLAER